MNQDAASQPDAETLGGAVLDRIRAMCGVEIWANIYRCSVDRCAVNWYEVELFTAAEWRSILMQAYLREAPWCALRLCRDGLVRIRITDPEAL